MPDTGPLHFPHVPPVDNGPRWLPRKDPPPLGEWIFLEAISLGMESSNQWVLRCYPIFEARIHWQSVERRFHLTMNGTDFGRFRNLDVARQRAEREIINRMREVMPALAIVRRRLLSKPVAREPPDLERKISMKPLAREPRRVCICGVVGNDKTRLWGVPDRWREITYYCYDCLPADMKEIVDKPVGGQGCTGFTPAKCECLRDALYVEDGEVYCEECRPRGTQATDG
jgi:hypothetical protein